MNISETRFGVTIDIVHAYRCTKKGDATLYCGRGRPPFDWQVDMRLGNPHKVTHECPTGVAAARFDRDIQLGHLPRHIRRFDQMAKRIVRQQYQHIQLACWCAGRFDHCHCETIRHELHARIGLMKYGDNSWVAANA